MGRISNKIVCFVLATVMLLSSLPIYAIAANVSEVVPTASSGTSAPVGPIEAVTVFNKATSQCLNYDYGKLSNGNPVRTWAYDGEGQIWDVVRVSDGVFRIVTNADQSYALDVYCPGRELKKGLAVDIWKAGGAEAFAQNLVIEYSGEGSYYYLRMAKNKNLCIASNGKNNALKLVEFTGADAQKWYFKDSNGKNAVDVTATSGNVSSTPLPTEMYVKNSAEYTVDGCKYYRATTTEKCTSVKPGTEFWLDGSGRVVLSDNINNKLFEMNSFNNHRIETMSNMDHVNDKMQKYANLYLGLKDLNNYAKFVGYSSGVLLTFAANPSMGLKKIAFKIVKDNINMSSTAEAVLVTILQFYSEVGNDSAQAAQKMLFNNIYDYDEYQLVNIYIAQTHASDSAIESLIGEEVRKDLNKSKLSYALSTLRSLLGSLASSIWPDGAFLSEIVEGIQKFGSVSYSFYDVVHTTQVDKVYDKRYQSYFSAIYDYDFEFTARKIAECGENYANFNIYVARGLEAKLDAIKAKYPEGSKVSHSYEFPKTVAYECHGFACYALMQFFGTKKPGISNKSYISYKATASNSYVDKIRPGDLVRFRNDDYDHTIVVTNVDDKNIYYADCNSDLKCTFMYDKSISKDELAKCLTKKLNKQKVSKRGYILHYKNNDM